VGPPGLSEQGPRLADMHRVKARFSLCHPSPARLRLIAAWSLAEQAAAVNQFCKPGAKSEEAARFAAFQILGPQAFKAAYRPQARRVTPAWLGCHSA
jgi:hypothetical protein